MQVDCIYMDTHKLFMLNGHFNFVNNGFLRETLGSRTMFRFCSTFCGFICSLVFNLCGFIIKHMSRSQPVDDFHRKNLNPGDACSRSDDQKFSNDSESDVLIEKQFSNFSFGSQFQIGKDSNKSFAETESSVSKYQFMSGKDVSGFVKEPKTMSFSVEESFQGSSGDFLNSSQNPYGGIFNKKNFQENFSKGSNQFARDHDQFIEIKLSASEFHQKLISESEFVDQHQPKESFESSSAEEVSKGQEQSVDNNKVHILENISNLEELNAEDSRSSDDEVLLNKDKSEDTDDEFIELEPHLQYSSELTQENGDEGLHEQKPLNVLGNSEEDSLKKKTWEWDSDEDEDEFDILMDHQDLVEQMKMELRNSRTGGLPTILEESETPKNAEDLKPLIIDEKLEYRDLMEQIHKFYKSYSEKMRKLDILNYQTLHAISILQMKEPAKLISSHKSAVSVLKSLLLPNFYPSKPHRIYADQTVKSISELHRDLELVYVGQVCLSWEILHWQYGKAKELQEYDSQEYHSYNLVAGEFQQFQVLMQRFIEDEHFQGPRVQNYVRKQHVLRSLLQVPPIKDDYVKDKRGREEEDAISLPMLTETIEESMRIFWEFLRADKDYNIIGFKGFRSSKAELQDPAHSELLVNIKSSLQKKDKHLKEILRSGNCIVKQFQKHQGGGRLKHELFLCQVELRLISRVLNLSRLTTEQLAWSQEKLSRINFVNRRISMESSFLLFPF